MSNTLLMTTLFKLKSSASECSNEYITTLWMTWIKLLCRAVSKLCAEPLASWLALFLNVSIEVSGKRDCGLSLLFRGQIRARGGEGAGTTPDRRRERRVEESGGWGKEVRKGGGERGRRGEREELRGRWWVRRAMEGGWRDGGGERGCRGEREEGEGRMREGGGEEERGY